MPRLITIHKTTANAYFSLAATVLSLVLILAGAVGLLLFQKPLRVSTEDVRTQATVTDGKVQLSTTYTANTSNGDHALSIYANTQNTNVERFELVFNLITHTFTSSPRIVLLPNTNLQLTKTEIEQTSDGFLISIIAVPQFSGNSFVSTTPKGLLQLQFYPTRQGTLSLNFDAEKSLAKVVNSSVGGDQLHPNEAITYSITRSTASSSFKQCNETCANNKECAAGFRCFENRCRLATYPTNSSCDVPDDKGLQRSCNEYCADTRECKTGFTCFYNRCRQPSNPDSASCAVTTMTQQQVIAQNCNKGCASNDECANNMRCFQGACRLATNPSSTSCSAPTKRTVSTVYYPVIVGPSKGTPAEADLKPTSGSTTKPGTGSTTASGSGTKAGVATPSAQPTASVPPLVLSTSPVPTIKPSPVITPLPAETVINNWSLSSLPMIALSAGIGLLVLVILIAIVNLTRRRSGVQQPVAQQAQKGKAYENDIQAKIDALRQREATQASTPAVITPAPSSRPFTPPPQVMPSRPLIPTPAMTNPTQNLSQPPATLQTPSQTITTGQTTPTFAPLVRQTQALPPANSPSSMMERLKQKGIQLPTDNPRSNT